MTDSIKIKDGNGEKVVEFLLRNGIKNIYIDGDMVCINKPGAQSGDGSGDAKVVKGQQQHSHQGAATTDAAVDTALANNADEATGAQQQKPTVQPTVKEAETNAAGGAEKPTTEVNKKENNPKGETGEKDALAKEGPASTPEAANRPFGNNFTEEQLKSASRTGRDPPPLPLPPLPTPSAGENLQTKLTKASAELKPTQKTQELTSQEKVAKLKADELKRRTAGAAVAVETQKNLPRRSASMAPPTGSTVGSINRRNSLGGSRKNKKKKNKKNKTAKKKK